MFLTNIVIFTAFIFKMFIKFFKKKIKKNNYEDYYKQLLLLRATIMTNNIKELITDQWFSSTWNAKQFDLFCYSSRLF